jgi:glucose-1-phosphate cytidylyltransferase
MDVHQNYSEPWSVTLIDTGEETMTGGRLLRAARYLKDEEAFCFTYGDGVFRHRHCSTRRLHEAHGAWPPSPPCSRRDVTAPRAAGDQVLGFTEKPRGDGGWINGGFFVLSPKVLSYIAGDETSWEAEPLARLAEDEQLNAFEHEGFWQPMDTLRDKNHLEALWQSGRPHGSNGPECGFLARQARTGHRPHRFQGQLADPVAAEPWRRVSGFRWIRRPNRTCMNWRECMKASTMCAATA